MSAIAKWTLQLVVLFLFAWLASVAAQWSSKVVSGTSNDRLAQAQPYSLVNEPIVVSAVKEHASTQAR